ncbi:zinc finger MYM-type protein 1-like [Stegodyphus dumicola]|uniref:zinc finger MYM-type protein 1-like n=1 Tax=Stegodyphus dumicola TaxID=202533 RepID=UPI0015B1AA46|nr:zinc finger MYM-type protein 1-like [Stegodyphus dumicola]
MDALTTFKSLEKDDALCLVSDDPGKWPINLTHSQVQYIIENFPSQVQNIAFPRDEQNKKFSESYFYRTLSNGEKIHRPWLLYSLSLNSVFCAPCKLFCTTDVTEKKERIYGKEGVNDWQQLSLILKRHESRLIHIKYTKQMHDLSVALKKGTTIDSSNQRLYELEKNHWRAVIERLMLIVRYLSRQCLAFRGSSQKLFQPDNGNFLQLTQMISKFDAVLSEHLRRIQSKNYKNAPHYLGWEHQNEMIKLLATTIQEQILDRIREAKYFSIILDCTPDISHTEQITVIIRCVPCVPPVKIYEHFLGFCPITDTTG